MRFSRLLGSVLIGATALTMPGCSGEDRQKIYDKGSNYTVQDRDLGYDRDDYKNALRPRPVEKSDSLDNIPQLAPVISEDKKNILPQPLVSITVNQDVPIRDIFYELAKQAEVDLELDPTITGSIIFTAYNRPFDQVVARISDMAGLRYKFKNNVLRIERDTPYMKTYNVNYISMERKYTSSIKSNTSASGGSSGGGGGSSNGSTSTVDIKNTVDFWDELSKNITQLIDSTNQQVALTDQSAPVSTPQAQAIPPVSQQQLANVNGANGSTPNATGTPGATAGAPGSTGANGAAPTAGAATGPTTINVGTGQPVSPPPATMAAAVSAPATPNAPVAGLANPTGGTNAVAGGGASGGASGGGSSSGASGSQSAYFSINQQAGLLNVFATEKQQQKIKAYLDQLMKAVNTQVLIEAKVFEVELSDDNSLGIDWSAISSDGKFNFGTTFDKLSFAQNPVSNPGGIFTFSSGNVDAVVNAISRFGTVRALSSPRLSVMNNQTAVLNVSESRVFFKLTLDRTEATTTSAGHTDVTSEINSVPEGLIIMVHPSVDPDTNEITMNLRPSITRVVDTVNDPAVAYIAAQSPATAELTSPIPELSIREIDSVVKMNSGKTILMGGLMQDRANGTQQSVPFLGEIPVLGNLFRSHVDSSHKTEMVIMLQATVLDAPSTDDTDKDLYKNMGQDRHPFKN